MSRKDKIALLVVFVFGILAARSLFGTGYFPMHDDLQLMRQIEMEKCFNDGQIPCRWVPDMGYGFGYPLFNFYPPLPYLIGQVIRWLGFSFTETVRGLFILSLVFSGVAMYFLSKEFFGRLGGVLSAVFYIWAPYHAVDIYVRGAMNESWALVWFPLIFWSSYKLLSQKNNFKWLVILSLSWFALLTSHNLMVMIFGPFFGVWSIFWLISNKAWRRIPQLLIAGIWALGLAAFFTVPAIAENQFTHINSTITGYYDYKAHFVSVRQLLFSRFWGYGPSVWEAKEDGMSFQIGHFHWILTILILGLLALRFLRERKISIIYFVVIAAIAGGWFVAFLTHFKSVPFWELLKPLQYLQFPWRLLALVIFLFSFAVGVIAVYFNRKWFAIFMVALLTISLVGFNWNYFRPEGGKLGPLNEEEKFSGVAWELQQTAGIYDYLPKSAKIAPNGPRKDIAEFMKGVGEISDVKYGTDWLGFKVRIDSESAILRINVINFPVWRIFVNGEEIKSFTPEEEMWGRMWIEVPRGEKRVVARLFNTPVRIISNTISLVSWCLLFLVIYFKLRERKLRVLQK